MTQTAEFTGPPLTMAYIDLIRPLVVFVAVSHLDNFTLLDLTMIDGSTHQFDSRTCGFDIDPIVAWLRPGLGVTA